MCRLNRIQEETVQRYPGKWARYIFQDRRDREGSLQLTNKRWDDINLVLHGKTFDRVSEEQKTFDEWVIGCNFWKELSLRGFMDYFCQWLAIGVTTVCPPRQLTDRHIAPLQHIQSCLKNVCNGISKLPKLRVSNFLSIIGLIWLLYH